MPEYTRRQRIALEQENKSWPPYLVQVPKDVWPTTFAMMANQPTEVWRSREFLLQVFEYPENLLRLSVNRTSIIEDMWRAEISWDELQRLKSECGRGDADAIEIYPPDSDVINVANMRHLWVLPERIPFAWRGGRQSDVQTIKIEAVI